MRIPFRSIHKRPEFGAVLSVILAFPCLASAQVTVDQSLTPTQYVNDVLLGEGVSATNVSFTGSSSQIGYMTGGASIGFPIEGGLVLSSGNAADAFCAGLGCFDCRFRDKDKSRLKTKVIR
jgi:hypothetical protein